MVLGDACIGAKNDQRPAAGLTRQTVAMPGADPMIGPAGSTQRRHRCGGALAHAIAPRPDTTSDKGHLCQLS
jgi:hypothetical protein